MSRITWNEQGTRLYSAGLDRGVLYPGSGPGVVWNGLVSVREASSGTDELRYFDGQGYFKGGESDSFAGTIEAFTYPDELDIYLANSHRVFDLSYRTQVSNDLGDQYHRIHLVYNVKLNTPDVSYSTISEGTSPALFSWDFTTKPVQLPNLKPSAHLYIDTSHIRPSAMETIESVIYGSEGTSARLPSFPDLLELFESLSILRIIDHGDGTWTAQGPDDVIRMLDPTTFEISWPTAVYLDENTYKISSD